MHIKIENDQNETVAVLCIERGHDTARILYSEPEYIRNLEVIAKSLGAGVMLLEVVPGQVEEYKDLGFTPCEHYVVMDKVLK